MLIEISGNRCVSCARYTQYYGLGYDGEFRAIDCGYCGQRQCRTRPGNKCKEYREAGNVGGRVGSLVRGGGRL